LAQTDDRAAERSALVDAVRVRLDKMGFRHDRYVRSALEALRTTPRHLFVPQMEQADAYRQKPVPIGNDQTISDPYIVTVMTTLLRVKKGDRILEVGTGSGFQAAILAHLGAEVYTVEIVDRLALAAAERLAALGYAKVHVRSGDGYDGWPEQAPFDAIIVTAGASMIPPMLLAQLKPGGQMVIPLGPNWAQEELVLITKARDGKVRRRSFGHVFFVDFTGAIKQEPRH
jgi:protein-L-isoaspartate(D-aspartate) O-methyltransferase